MARFDLEVQPFEGELPRRRAVAVNGSFDRQLRRLARIAEPDVAETDPSTRRGRIEPDRVRRGGDLGLHVQVLEDAVEQRQGALQLDLEIEQLAEWEEESAWRVVKATMSPIVGGCGSWLMAR